MRFSQLALAFLPALALANDDTTTKTSTTVLVKTYFLSEVHTVTSTGIPTNTSTPVEVVSTPVETPTTLVGTPSSSSDGSATTTNAAEPSTVKDSGASALGAANLAAAGVAGMIAFALM